MESRLSFGYYLRLAVITVMALTLSAQTAFTQSSSPPQDSPDPQTADSTFSAPTPEKSSDSGNTTTWLLVGGAVVLGVGALALGSGGGGGDSSPSADPVEETSSMSSSNDDDDVKDDDDEEIEIESEDSSSPYTGPDLNGSWSGFINLVNEGNENVSISASVSQDGRNISISTSSPYSYARNFSGKISSSGNIKVKDGNTGEIWTTHSGAASASSIRIFDWVNDYTELDRIELSR
jgi:hypothetical protein